MKRQDRLCKVGHRRLVEQSRNTETNKMRSDARDVGVVAEATK